MIGCGAVIGCVIVGNVVKSEVGAAIVLLKFYNFCNIYCGNGWRRLIANTTSNKSSIKAHLAILQLSEVVLVGSFCHLRHHIVQDFELTPGEDKVQSFPNADHDDQHQGEEDRSAREGLDHPEHDQARQLDQGEQVDATDWDLLR